MKAQIALNDIFRVCVGRKNSKAFFVNGRLLSSLGLETVPTVLLSGLRQASTCCVFLLVSVILFFGCSKAVCEE